jgi:hypothetical protein
MVGQPPLPKFVETNRCEAQCDRRADLQLRIDLGSELTGGLPIRSDTGAMASTVLMVAQVPNLAAQVRLNTANTEGR